MKSKLFHCLTAALVATAALAACPAYAAKVRVVTTLTDLADLTRAVGGQYVDVFSLATGVEDTHGVPMKPSFVPIMNRADLLVSVGFGCEHAFLPALIEASKNPRIQYRETRLRGLFAGHRAARRPEVHRSLRRGRPSLRQPPLHARPGSRQDRPGAHL